MSVRRGVDFALCISSACANALLEEHIARRSGCYVDRLICRVQHKHRAPASTTHDVETPGCGPLSLGERRKAQLTSRIGSGESPGIHTLFARCAHRGLPRFSCFSADLLRVENGTGDRQPKHCNFLLLRATPSHTHQASRPVVFTSSTSKTRRLSIGCLDMWQKHHESTPALADVSRCLSATVVF